MPPPETISAVVLAYDRVAILDMVLDRLEALDEIEEVIVVDAGPAGIAARVNARGGKARALVEENLGAAARNTGARAARGSLLLMLDDDSHPVPGAVAHLVAALESDPQIGVVGGFINNVDLDGRPWDTQDYGTFDWWLRAGNEGTPPPEGWPAFSFPEGGALLRREAFLEAGGFFAPYFFASSEVDLATRLIARGWDVRYQPQAVFNHLRGKPGAAADGADVLRHRVRNHLWYLWLRFPPSVALPRMVGYLLFDLIECIARGHPRAWLAAVGEAWQRREEVRPYREPLPREIIRRAELNRGRRHALWLLLGFRRRVRETAGRFRAR